MAVANLKEATKDIDVVVETSEEVHALESVLTNLGYSKATPNLEIDGRMRASVILQNPDGFRWDIFERVVAGKFHLSPGMKLRARTHETSTDRLVARLLSMEDVFLMKGVTEREGDLQDMATIAEHGMKWETIAKECDWQSKRSGRIWENSVCNSLKELKAKYRITSPVEKKICRSAEKKILALQERST